MAGIADAPSVDQKRPASVVIDWKSEVSPARKTLDLYRAQVRAYFDMLRAERGLIVLMTSGTAIAVPPSHSS
jgi:exodeoxyribonuclease-5